MSDRFVYRLTRSYHMLPDGERYTASEGVFLTYPTVTDLLRAGIPAYQAFPMLNLQTPPGMERCPSRYYNGDDYEYKLEVEAIL